MDVGRLALRRGLFLLPRSIILSPSLRCDSGLSSSPFGHDCIGMGGDRTWKGPDCGGSRASNILVRYLIVEPKVLPEQV
jgi:hypothetical protein